MNFREIFGRSRSLIRKHSAGFRICLSVRRLLVSRVNCGYTLDSFFILLTLVNPGGGLHSLECFLVCLIISRVDNLWIDKFNK